MDNKRLQINLKLDSQKRGQLTHDELELISTEELNKLHDSVSTYLQLIESVKSQKV